MQTNAPHSFLVFKEYEKMGRKSATLQDKSEWFSSYLRSLIRRLQVYALCDLKTCQTQRSIENDKFER